MAGPERYDVADHAERELAPQSQETISSSLDIGAVRLCDGCICMLRARGRVR